MVIKVKYISLVNLILDKLAIKELIQYDFTFDNTKKALSEILTGKEREKILSDYSTLLEKVGGPGATEKAAKLMVERIKSA